YLSADYGGAVSDGKVTSESEYKEQLALLDDAAKIAGRLGTASVPGAAPLDLTRELARVRALADAKASESEVSAAIEPLRASIIGGFALAEAPTAPPNAMRGRALYTE